MSSVLQEAQERWSVSWSDAWLAYNSRVENNLQPSLPGANLKTMVIGNSLYLTICAILAIVMSRRSEGFRLQKLLIVYNAICVLLAGYVAIGILLFKLQHPGTFACNPLHTSESGQQMAFIFWVFYAQKYWEFCDTWFYILRRSFRQVTFLHLFHHASITLVVGSIIRFDFSGDMYLPVLLNSIVHVLMYSHYLLTAFGIKSWWRPYLTTLQITQFCAISCQSWIAYTNHCGAPDFAKLILISYMASMIVLFLNFFIRRYVLHKSTATMSGVIKSVNPKFNKCTHSGVTVTDAIGKAVIMIPVPEEMRLLRISKKSINVFRYQLTPIGDAMPSLHVEKELMLKTSQYGVFVIAGATAFGKVSWQVEVLLNKQRKGL